MWAVDIQIYEDLRPRQKMVNPNLELYLKTIKFASLLNLPRETHLSAKAIL
jgi:hypothetical protein